MEEKKIDKFGKILNYIKSILICIFLIYLIITLIKNTTIQKTLQQNNNITDRIKLNINLVQKAIDENYLGNVDKNSLVTNTLKGYVAGLKDEYSEYYTSEEWDKLHSELEGEFVGIGVVMQKDKTTKKNNIIEVIENSPAAQNDIRIGDIIFEINNENVENKELEEISKKIRGKANTEVNIKLYRNNDIIEKKIMRQHIKVSSVKSKKIEDTIGYISISNFDMEAGKDFYKEYIKLKNEIPNMDKLIIDLRSNTGGNLKPSIEIAEMFLPKGKVIFSTVDKSKNEEITYSKSDAKIHDKIVILVNEYTASASELLASAISQNISAKIVGTTTFGKGVIQIVKQLENGDYIKLTTAEYVTPNGTHLNKNGIKPDIEVKLTKEDIQSANDVQLQKAIEEIKK